MLMAPAGKASQQLSYPTANPRAHGCQKEGISFKQATLCTRAATLMLTAGFAQRSRDHSSLEIKPSVGWNHSHRVQSNKH